MCFEFLLSKDERHVSKKSCFQHLAQVHLEGGVGNVHPDGEHLDIVKTILTIIATKDVQVSFDNIRGVAASWAGLDPVSGDLLPLVLTDFEDMHVVHPLHTIVPSEIIYLLSYKAPCGGYPRAWDVSAHLGFHPSQICSVEVEDVVQLSKLVGLSSENKKFVFVAD